MVFKENAPNGRAVRGKCYLLLIFGIILSRRIFGCGRNILRRFFLFDTLSYEDYNKNNNSDENDVRQECNYYKQEHFKELYEI